MEESMNEIGTRIRSRRNELNITQTQVYKEIGISTGNLSSIESGKILPSSMALIGLSRVLKCSTDWILTGNDNFSESEIFNNREMELISNFRKLSLADQEELQDYLIFKLTRNNHLHTKSYSTLTEKEDYMSDSKTPNHIVTN